MAWGDDFEDGEQEEDEEEAKDSKDFDMSADYIMVLILAVKSMFEPDSSGQAPVITAFKLVQRLLKQKIILSRRDKVGVLLVGVDQARDPAKEDEDLECSSGYYALQDLDQPTAKRIRDLDVLSSQGPEDVISELRLQWHDKKGEGSSTVKLNAALRACSGAFARGGAKPHDSRRIWLFTNDDSPRTEDADPTSSLSDQLGQGAQLKLWYFNRPGSHPPFDMSKYWAPTLKQLGAAMEDEEGDEDELGLSTPEDAREALDRPASETRHQGSVKRRYTRMPLRLSPSGPSVHVALYKTLAPCRPPQPIHTRASTVERIMPRTNLITDSGIALPPDQAKTGVVFAQSDVFVSKQDVAQAAAFGAKDTGMDLLGFLPQSLLRWDLNSQPATFTYPDDSELRGSTSAFIALHSAMVTRHVMALVSFHRSPTTAPRLAVLVPQPETDRDPPGLQLLYLPWADDARALPSDTCVPADPGLVKAARAMVAKLTSAVPFDSTEVPNPALQKLYANLEALALMEKEAKVWDDEADDLTRPPTQAMLQAAEEEIDALVEASGLASEAAEGGGGKRKRPAAAPKKEGGGKRAKEEGQEVDVVALVRDGRLESLTVPELKDVCGSLQLAKGGKKADLVERITEHVQKQGGGGKAEDEEGGKRKKKKGGGGKRVRKEEDDDDEDEMMLD